MNQIIGKPNDGYNYEFYTVRKRDDGDLDWIGSYEWFPVEAENSPEKLLVVHDVRIAHKEKIK